MQPNAIDQFVFVQSNADSEIHTKSNTSKSAGTELLRTYIDLLEMNKFVIISRKHERLLSAGK